MTCPLGSQKNLGLSGRLTIKVGLIYLNNFFFVPAAMYSNPESKKFPATCESGVKKKHRGFPKRKTAENGTHHLHLCQQKIPAWERICGTLGTPWGGDHPRTCKWIGNSYCWWVPKSGQPPRDDDDPIIYRSLTIPGGAGFLPSTAFISHLWAIY